MSALLGERDRLIMNTVPRYFVSVVEKTLLLQASTPVFAVSRTGNPTPAAITITAELVSITGTVEFSVSAGAALAVDGKVATLRFVDMSVDVAFVQAKVKDAESGVEFLRSAVVSKVFDGVNGAAGVDGATYYTWVKYGDSAAGAGLSDSPAGKAFIGLAYNKTTPVEGTNPADYTWSLIKGTDGVPGAPGADGLTTYTWIKYSDLPDGTGLYDVPTVATLYLGLATNKTTSVESDNKADYTWSKFKGDQGVPGAAATTYYTWLKYADGAAGAGLSDDPSGKAYIGLAYNKTTPVESSAPGDYAWSLIKGTDGIPGTKGADGATLYTWIKYADQADGAGLYDVPNDGTLYIGLATNRPTAVESLVKTDYVWSKFRGDQGVPGTPGLAAPTLYTWVKYADTAAGAGLVDDPTGKAWIGLAYNKLTPVESLSAGDYAWSLIRGADGVPGTDGANGLPGVKGADGQTFYTWIKYADVADGAGMYDTPNANTLYLGLSTNRTSQVEGSNPADYVWSKFKGDQGVPGTAAPALYTWVKYADSAAGAGLTDNPAGKAFIGLAYNQTTAIEGTDPAQYTWSLIKGVDGVPGAPGADGLSLYTWIKYADYADGAGLYDIPGPTTMYIGLSVNRAVQSESGNKEDYVWSKFRGDQGVPGTTGPQGQRGTKTVVAGGYSTWSDASAAAELTAAGFGAPINRDVVTLYGPIISAPTFTLTKFFDNGSWLLMGTHIDGGLLVSGTVAAAAMSVDRLSALSANLGNVNAGDMYGVSIRGGSFTDVNWPATGGGFYLGPDVFRMGSYPTGKYFEVYPSGDVHAPGFDITNGVARFGGELSGVTGSFHLVRSPTRSGPAGNAGSGSGYDLTGTGLYFYDGVNALPCVELGEYIT
ncbi:hypothetical protein [Janthinobacterium sp. PC23-8]|uniref:hypothetical protein n=1 Tax=Janthinobacterium sp. PC23-8 TaxID=2012679 RepID=UPI000B96E6F1|nr:hypothetical protein [Janthinobacterium sp. PC23-8]OYO29142.1 hypothetical protein CD932_18740 [Janthinobacterium sp. PC23-8]